MCADSKTQGLILPDDILSDGYQWGTHLRSEGRFEIYRLDSEHEPTRRASIIQGGDRDRNDYARLNQAILDIPADLPCVGAMECDFHEGNGKVSLVITEEIPQGFAPLPVDESLSPTQIHEIARQSAEVLRDLHKKDLFHGKLTIDSLLVRFASKGRCEVRVDGVVVPFANRHLLDEENGVAAGKQHDFRRLQDVLSRLLVDSIQGTGEEEDTLRRQLEEITDPTNDEGPLDLDEFSEVLSNNNDVEAPLFQPIILPPPEDVEPSPPEGKYVEMESSRLLNEKESFSPTNVAATGGAQTVADFFDLVVSPGLVAWRDDYKDKVRIWQNLLRGQAANDRERSLRTLVEVLDVVEEDLDKNRDSLGQNLVGLILDYLLSMSMIELPRGPFDFQLTTLDEHLFGLNCKFENCEDDQPVRAGSIIRVERVGLLRHGEVVRPGRIVVSLGPKHPAVGKVENLIRSHPDHPLRAALHRLKETVESTSHSSTSEFPEDRLSVTLEILDAFLHHDSLPEKQELEELIDEFLKPHNCKVIPPIGATTVSSSLSLKQNECSGQFRSAKGKIVSIRSYGIERGDERIHDCEVVVGLGDPPAVVEKFESLIQDLEFASDAEALVVVVRECLAETTSQALALWLGSEVEGWGPKLTRSLVVGLNEIVESNVHSPEGMNRILEKVDEVLEESERGEEFRLIPDAFDRERLTDVAPDLARYDVLETRVDEELTAFQKIEVLQYGFCHGDRVIEKAGVRVCQGGRAAPMAWLSRIRELVGTHFPELDGQIDDLVVSIRDWYLGSTDGVTRQRLCSNLLGLISECETIGLNESVPREDRDLLSNMLCNNLEGEIGDVLKITPIPSLDKVDDRVDNYDQACFDEVAEQYHDSTPGTLVSIAQQGYRDDETGFMIRQARVTKSRGLAQPGVLLAETCDRVVSRLNLPSDHRLVHFVMSIQTAEGELPRQRWIILLDIVAENTLPNGTHSGDTGSAWSELEKLARGELVVHGVETGVPPDRVNMDITPSGFDVDWVFDKNIARESVIRVARPKLIDVEDDGVIQTGRLVASLGPVPALLSNLSDSSYWKDTESTIEWVRQKTIELQGAANVVDEAALVREFVAFVNQEFEPKVDDLRQEVERVLPTGDFSLIPAEGVVASDFPLEALSVTSREDEAVAGTVVEVCKWGLLQGDEVLAQGEAMVSKGPSGPLLPLVEGLREGLKPQEKSLSAQAKIVVELAAKADSWIEQAEREPELRHDPRSIVSLLNMVVKLRVSWLPAPPDFFRQFVERVLRATKDLNWTVFPESINTISHKDAPDFVEVVALSAMGSKPLGDILWTCGLVGPDGEVVQRGEILSTQEKPDELSAILYRFLEMLQESMLDAALPNRTVELLKSVASSNAAQKLSIALLPLNWLWEAADKGSISVKTAREMGRALRVDYLAKLGWEEYRVLIGGRVDKLSLKYVKIEGVARPTSTIQAVLRPGFTSKDMSRVLQKALIRID